MQYKSYASLRPKPYWVANTRLFKDFRDFMLKYDRLPTVKEVRDMLPGASKKAIQRQLKNFRRHLGIRPDPSYSPRAKERLRTGKRKPHPIYGTDRWRALRFDILKRDGRKCRLCGRGPDKTSLHVDHIVPISIDPSKTWDPDNLQVLCQDCNLGKSNRDQTDFRNP